MEQKQKKKDETHTAATERRDDPVVRDGGRSGAGRPPYHAHLRAGYGKSTKPRVQGISATFCHREAESGAKRVGAMMNTRTALASQPVRFCD
jgi:hypothetical protein